MDLNLSRLLLVVLICIPFSSQAGMMGVEPLIENGQIVGAKNVPVDSSDDGIDNPDLYSVRFTQSSCLEIFGSCDFDTEFDFSSFGAAAAAQALLDHVFVNSPEGQFDDDTSKTDGCTFTTQCSIWIFYGLVFDDMIGMNFAVAALADNRMVEADDRVKIPAATEADIRFDGAPAGTASAWRLQLSTTIPEPATLALMGLGIAGLRFRRKLN